MSPSILFHLFRTEFRRDLWLVLLFWLLLLFLREPLAITICGAFLAARIAQGEHLARIGADWKTRPASFGDWMISRVMLIFGIFVLPVAIQQGWIAHLIGLNRSAIFILVVETGMVTMVATLSVFMLATLAGSWARFAILIIASYVLLFSLMLVPGWMNALEDSSWSGVWWVYWGTVIVLSVSLLVLIHSRPDGKWFLCLPIVVPLSGITLMWAYESEASGSRHELSARVQPVPRKVEDRTQQPIFREVALAGLKEDEFAEFNRIQIGDVEHHPEWETDSGWATLRFQNFFARRALLSLLAPDQRVLVDRTPAVFPDDETILPFPITKKGSPKNEMEVSASIYALRKITEFPLRSGSGATVGNCHFILERRRGSRNTRSFTLVVTRPALLLARDPSENRNVNSTRYKAERWKLVLENPNTKESILLGTQERSGIGESRLFEISKEQRLEFTVYDDPAWRLLWPEKNAAEATGLWLEEAVLKVFFEEYQGRTKGSVLLPDH